jgi:hypothetical protein
MALQAVDGAALGTSKEKNALKKLLAAIFASAALFALSASSALAAPPGEGCPDNNFSHANSSRGILVVAPNTPGAARNGGILNNRSINACT